MELSGKVIIFQNDEESAQWFSIIKEFNQRKEIETVENEMRNTLEFYRSAEEEYNFYKESEK